MSDIDVQIERIMKSIRQDVEAGRAIYVEIACNDKLGALKIDCFPDGVNWLFRASGRVTVEESAIAYEEVTLTVLKILRVAFDKAHREKLIMKTAAKVN